MTEGPLDKTLRDGTRVEGSESLVPQAPPAAAPPATAPPQVAPPLLSYSSKPPAVVERPAAADAHFEPVRAVPRERYPTGDSPRAGSTGAISAGGAVGGSGIPPSGPPSSRSRAGWLTSPWLFAGVGTVLVMIACGLVARATHAATSRLEQAQTDRPQVAVADQAEVAYCTPEFKLVLERVLHACGLEGANSRHGCQPSDVKSFASISDEDFNALFTPLKDRGAVLLFDNNSEELDAAGKKLLEERFVDRRGARYFFAVARASKSGNQAKNRALSHRRANSVKFHVAEASGDPDLDRKLGQLWLGNEFAQLSTQFCDWPSSRPDQKCSAESINRSVFVSWVDCRL